MPVPAPFVPAVPITAQLIQKLNGANEEHRVEEGVALLALWIANGQR